MKNNHLFSALVVVAMCLLPACTTYQHTSRSTDITSRTIDSHAMTANLRVDFEQKVTGESRRDCRSRKEAMENAIYNAIVTHKVDVVVDPIYEIQVEKHFGHAEFYAQLVGFAGYYEKAEISDDPVKNVREAADLKEDDIIKFKLLTDPDFAYEYYRKDHKEGTHTIVYFNNGSGDMQVANPHEKKSHHTRHHASARPEKKQRSNIFSRREK